MNSKARDSLIADLQKYVRHMEQYRKVKPTAVYVTPKQNLLLGMKTFMGYPVRVVK